MRRAKSAQRQAGCTPRGFTGYTSCLTLLLQMPCHRPQFSNSPWVAPFLRGSGGVRFLRPATRPQSSLEMRPREGKRYGSPTLIASFGVSDYDLKV
jgi:hypothetical protein